MRLTIPPVIQIAAVTALIVLGSACGADHEGPATETAHSEPGPFSDEVRLEPNMAKVASVIKKKRQELRAIEGREGILAEERLYSLFDEELIIRDFFQDRTEGFFLDVGCAWPMRASNTFYLEKHLGWKGIGIDALAGYAPGWKKERPNSRFFSYLVTDQSNLKQTFFMAPNPGLSSTDRGLASGETFGADVEPEEVEIETTTLDDLLDREGVTKIDLLSMDIEGHEPKALAGFDIERFQPELVVIEGQVVAANEVLVRGYFERHGYELIEKYRPFDTVNRYFKPKSP
jgi:FkbM family methyltransferase